MPGMPPMGVPGALPHPSHLPAQMPPIPQGQVPPMGMPMAWPGYYVSASIFYPIIYLWSVVSV
jgi:hypothetical protein